MTYSGRIILVFLGLIACTRAAALNPCDAVSSTSDVQFKLELEDGRTVFQEGELVKLTLTLTSNSKQLYRADERNYDRSGRLASEDYCVSPESPDPLASYFKT